MSEVPNTPRVPFGPVEEKPKFVGTNHARVECMKCGEWIYTIRRAEGLGYPFFPSQCPVCGAPTKDSM